MRIVKKILLSFALLVFLLPSIALAGSRGEVVQFLVGGIRDTSNQPLASGKVYAYSAGTLTAKDTYTDFNKVTPAANPIILDANGQAKVYADGAYKFIIKDSNDTTLYTYDNLNFNYDATDTIYNTTAGSGSAYTISISPAPGAYYTGMLVIAKAHAVSGASPTINVNGLGAKNLIKKNGAAVAAGDIVASQVFFAVYDGTNFLVVDGSGVNGAEQFGGTSSGSANTYAISLPATPGAYVNGAVYSFFSHQTNTSSTTLNINSIGAKAINTSDGIATPAGSIMTGTYVQVVYKSSADQFYLVPSEQNWATYTPSYPTSDGGQTFTGVTTFYARFLKRGNICFIQIGASGTTGGTPDVELGFTVPFTSATASASKFGHCFTGDAGSDVGHAVITSNSTSFYVAKRAFGNWGAGSGREFYCNFFYETNP